MGRNLIQGGVHGGPPGAVMLQSDPLFVDSKSLALAPRSPGRGREPAAQLGAYGGPGAATLVRAGTRNPTDGRMVLARMHAAYAGRWYESLAFVQHTTIIRADGGRDTSTWYETLKGPDLLRIDFGDPAAGRGVIYTAESTFVFRDARLARSGAEGNPFLPLVMGVYLQPVEATVRGLAHHGIDVSKGGRAVWEGRPAFIVGATNEADSAAPQFWVDSALLVVVLMRVPASGSRPALEARIDDYVPVDDAWLGTRIAISFGGVPRQFEEYTEWTTRLALPDSLFDRQHWVTPGHWAGAERSSDIWRKRTGS